MSMTVASCIGRLGTCRPVPKDASTRCGSLVHAHPRSSCSAIYTHIGGTTAPLTRSRQERPVPGVQVRAQVRAFRGPPCFWAGCHRYPCLARFGRWRVAGYVAYRWRGVAACGAAGVKMMPGLVRVRFMVIRLEKTPAGSFARPVSCACRAGRRRRAHGPPGQDSGQ
jgi:hypothetical protein